MLAVDRLISEKPAGWREMTVAMVDALAKIGDSRPLALLRRVQRVEGAGEIDNLAYAISTLEESRGLLRPVTMENRIQEGLLRPVEQKENAGESHLLLRPGSKDSA
jgi:hypothetical protein